MSSLDPVPEPYGVSDADLLAFVRRNTFAWVVSEAGGLSATPLPLHPRTDGAGRLSGFGGHFARNNPQVERLGAAPRARFLFMGPHGYVSPSWTSDRTRAPTWNYASVVFDCDLVLTDDPGEIEALLRDLIEPLEAANPPRWRLEEMGERYARIARGVVGFTAVIRDQRPVFKLGQKERDGDFAEVLAGLEGEGHDELAQLMRDHRPPN